MIAGWYPSDSGCLEEEAVPFATKQALMLDWLAQRTGNERCAEAAQDIEDAVDAAFPSGSVRSNDIGGQDGTQAVANAVIAGLGAWTGA